jgi:peroxin-2
LAPWDDAAGGPSRLPGRAFLSAARPELAAALDALAFAATVGRGAPTPGMRMLNLRHADVRGRQRAWASGDPSAALPGLTAGQRATYGLLSVGGRYAAARLGRAALARAWAARHGGGGGGGGGQGSPSTGAAGVASTLAALDTALAVGGLANLVAFLGGGAHRSLLERLIGAVAVPADPAAPRALSFDYLNRQLVWHGLAELMLFLLPLVEPARLGRAVRAWLPRPLVGSGAAAPSSSSPSSSLAAGASPAAQARPGGAARPTCGWCGRTDPPLPFAALPCTHVHCYWCLARATAGDAAAACPTCGVRVVAMVRAVRRRDKDA